jgi:hypothetical protein
VFLESSEDALSKRDIPVLTLETLELSFAVDDSDHVARMPWDGLRGRTQVVEVRVARCASKVHIENKYSRTFRCLLRSPVILRILIHHGPH